MKNFHQAGCSQLVLTGLVLSNLMISCHGSQTGQPTSPVSAPDSPPSTAIVVVPQATMKIEFDGALNEKDWSTAVRTGGFVDPSGKEAVPFSEARFLWDKNNLYVALYAIDQDIHSTVKQHDGPVRGEDSFRLRFHHADGPDFLIDIAPTGILNDASQVGAAPPDESWESKTVIGADRRGTINDSSDDDRDWVIEAAIPLGSLGLKGSLGTTEDIDISRCDTPKNGSESCGSFGVVKGTARLQFGPPAKT